MVKPTIELGHHLVPGVLARLAALAPLPEQGVVAGQSVASALMEELGKGPGVYNDIDIFMPADAQREAEMNSQGHLERESLRLGIPLASLDEYRALGMTEGSDLHILGSTEDGVLNYVWCKCSDELTLSPAKIVYSFDLNCVEVAIDLKTKRLYWSQGFEYFLQTRELQITSVSTPVRTLLRYLKKRDELKAFGKDEFVANMLAGWMDWTSNGQEPKTLLSSKYAQLARQYAAGYQGVFSLEESPVKMQLTEDWQYPQGMEDLLSSTQSDYCEAEGLVRLVPAMLYGTALATPAEAPAAVKEARVLCGLDDSEETVSPDNGMVDAVQLSLWFLGWKYLEGQRSKTHFEVVRRTLAKHPGLCSALVGLTLDEQYRCVLDLKRRAKRDGEHVFGLVETSAFPADMWNQSHRDAFFERIEIEETQTLLSQPLFETMETEGWTVQELLTVRALRVEGAQMNHCVGGYSQALKTGRSRILSVRKGTDRKRWSTVELRMMPKSKTFVVQQHRGLKNAAVHADNVKRLAEYLAREGARTGWVKEERKGVPGAFDIDVDFAIDF